MKRSGKKRALILAAVVGALGLVATMKLAWAEESGELERVCRFAQARPDLPEEGIEAYHRSRREMVHQVYETRLVGLDESVLDYDRLTGLLTMSGFRNYPVEGGRLRIGLRNACILGFEFEEERAHDVIAKVAMGRVELEIGFLLAGHDDFEFTYCVVGPEGEEELVVDLLYARLLDREAEGEARVLGRYQTREGHQWALRLSTLAVDAARMALPEVAVSHFQWRAQGDGWEQELEEEVEGELQEERARLMGAIERELYSCYLRGLGRNASLQGAMVMEVSAGEARWEEMEVVLDTMGEPEIRRCVRERMEELFVRESLEARGEVDGFKATILMRRR